MRIVFTFITFLFTLTSMAWASSGIDAILESETPPVGVVFEVVEGDQMALSWALPRVQEQSAHLKARFPDIKIAVVTHGNEQFGLMKTQESAKAGKIKSLAQSLSETGTPVHVCGGHADARGVARDAFPDYVDVAPSGPAQITAYRNEGYKLVILRKP